MLPRVDSARGAQAEARRGNVVKFRGNPDVFPCEEFKAAFGFYPGLGTLCITIYRWKDRHKIELSLERQVSDKLKKTSREVSRGR